MEAGFFLAGWATSGVGTAGGAARSTVRCTGLGGTGLATGSAAADCAGRARRSGLTDGVALGNGSVTLG
jgi:hypothetical protein